jgi:hypothetical protein
MKTVQCILKHKILKHYIYVITGNAGVTKQAPGSFIYSLRNKENLPPFKAPLKNQNDTAAVWANPNDGPTFGRSPDLAIGNNANSSNPASATYFGWSYQPPPGVSDPETILAGTKSFTVSQVEVFYLM